MKRKLTVFLTFIATVFTVAMCIGSNQAQALSPSSQEAQDLNNGQSTEVIRPGALEGKRSLEKLHNSGQWDERSKLLLAQALWGEAGISARYKTISIRGKKRTVPCGIHEVNPACRQNLDHEIIPWVLLRRWEHINRKGMRRHFGRVIQMYCSPLDPARSSVGYEMQMRSIGNFREVSQAKRRRFLQSLDWSGENLKGNWRRYGSGLGDDFVYHSWQRITDLVTKWGEGKIPNRCSQAQHWDMKSADVSARLPRIDCGRTLNAFYGGLS